MSQSNSDPLSEIAVRRKAKTYGVCRMCGGPQQVDGAAVVRTQVVRRKPKELPDESVVSRAVTVCGACGVKLWRAWEAVLEEHGL